MLAFQLGLLALCALVSMAFGLRYLVAREFMAYHAIVAGRAWQQVDTGLQTILLGMLRIIGGGLLTYGVALLWLLWPLSQRQAWAAGAAFTLTLTAVVPTLYVVVSQPISS